MSDSTFSPERWAQVRLLFEEALEIPRERRGAWLDERCGDDVELRGAVASLLSAHEQDGPLGSPSTEPGVMLDKLRTALAEQYDVTGPLGSGGMALVFLAQDLKHNRQVAIKVLRPELGLSLGIDRFQREIEIAAGLQHPHILPLFDSGNADGLFYYVMPYVDGETLADRLDRDGALPADEAMRMADQVLGALEYAHDRGVVHRDMKPSNILISRDTGLALVADFGIARAVSAAGPETLTAPGAIVGTPGYMPPEQARGERITPAVDVYAMGLVIFEALTGRDAPSWREMDSADWSGANHQRRALMGALHERPADRWENARAFREALVQTGAKRPVRKPVAALGGLALLVLVVGAFAARSWFGGPSAETIDADRLAVMPFAVRGSTTLQYLSEGMVDLFSTKLDGAGSLRSVDPRAVLSAVNRSGGQEAGDPMVAVEVSRQLNAGLFLVGDITEVGGQVQLSASLFSEQDPSTSLARVTAEGAEDDVLSLLDQMAADLLSQYGQGGDERLARIAVVTTQSLPALKSYLRGIKALRAAEFPLAASAFQEAITADSTFALAWYQLSIAADWLLRADLSRHAADQAVRYADRLSERDGRLLEALQRIRQGVVDEAEQLLRDILRTYPDDIEAWSQLAELLSHFGPRNLRPLEQSREAWHRFVELEPDLATGYIHLARIEAAHRNTTALDSLTQRALDLAPQGDRGLEMRMFRATLGATEEEMASLLRDLEEAPDELFGEAIWSSGFSQDPVIIEPMIVIATGPTRSPGARALGYAWAAHYSASRGRFSEMWRNVDSLMSIDSVLGLETGGFLAASMALLGDSSRISAFADRLAAASLRTAPDASRPDVWFAAHNGLHEHFRTYLVGTFAALRGQADRADATADELEGLPVPPGTGSLATDLAAGIRMSVGLVSGDWAAGLVAADEMLGHIWHQAASASPFFSGGYERFVRARLLEESGQIDQAVRWYTTFLETGPHDDIFLGPARIRLGRLSELLGDVDGAREHYAEFVRLWHDAAGPLSVSVADARTRVDLLSR